MLLASGSDKGTLLPPQVGRASAWTIHSRRCGFICVTSQYDTAGTIGQTSRDILIWRDLVPQVWFCDPAVELWPSCQHPSVSANTGELHRLVREFNSANSVVSSWVCGSGPSITGLDLLPWEPVRPMFLCDGNFWSCGNGNYLVADEDKNEDEGLWLRALSCTLTCCHVLRNGSNLDLFYISGSVSVLLFLLFLLSSSSGVI